MAVYQEEQPGRDTARVQRPGSSTAAPPTKAGAADAYSPPSLVASIEEDTGLAIERV